MGRVEWYVGSGKVNYCSRQGEIIYENEWNKKLDEKDGGITNVHSENSKETEKNI